MKSVITIMLIVLRALIEPWNPPVFMPDEDSIRCIPDGIIDCRIVDLGGTDE